MGAGRLPSWGVMAQPGYSTYDRVLDWFSDRRDRIAKVVVLVAVGAMMFGVVVGALVAIF